MSESVPPSDRRVALKARSRAAVLAAAADLMRERRSAEFTVDELAAAADVSRRTVFNHFASLEDVVTEVAGRLLSEAVDAIEARAVDAERRTESALEDLADAASADHLVPTVAYLSEVFGRDSDRQSTRGAVLMQRAFTLFTTQMSGALSRRRPEADEVSATLLTAAFCGGVLGLVDRWLADTGGVDSSESRRAWDDLLGSLIAVLRDPPA